MYEDHTPERGLGGGGGPVSAPAESVCAVSGNRWPIRSGGLSDLVLGCSRFGWAGVSVEGFARLPSEGISVLDCTAQSAANFVGWLREHIVPDGMAMTFNTAWGLEEDLPDATVPDVTSPRLVADFLAHLEALGLD